MKNEILVSAISFGYGPIVSVLNVCKKLHKIGIKMDFVGCTIALEQAKMTNYFENIYDIDTEASKNIKLLNKIFSKYKIGFFGENPEGCSIAKENGMKVFYIDNLMWMWDEISKKYENFDKYIISNTISSEENFNRIGKNIKNPLFVGPIREIDTTNNIEKNQLLINIGGAVSSLFDQNVINEFYQIILENILDVSLHKELYKVIICGGSTVLNSLHLKKYKNLEIKTLSNDDYLKTMAESKYCIFAPGLGNFVESIGKNKEIMFLPAINYSQFLQIEFYKSMNFGFKYLNWNDFPFFIDIPKYVDENIGVNLVEKNISEFLKGDYSEFIKKVTREFFDNQQSNYFSIRNTYVDSLEKNASDIIANLIIAENKEV